jgi:hypothetical protein
MTLLPSVRRLLLSFSGENEPAMCRAFVIAREGHSVDEFITKAVPEPTRYATRWKQASSITKKEVST